PSLGLAPNLLTRVFTQLHHINSALGVTILIVEQKVREVLKIANWVYGLRLGEIAIQGAPAEIGTESHLRELFLG
ncbi:MAG: ABC transporter ATP-binding protein, partial [bacterium]